MQPITGPELKRFRYNPRTFVRRLGRLLVWLGLFLLGATAIGQLRAERLPSWADLGLAASLPLIVFAVLAIAIHAMCRFFSVDVDASGIRSQNPFGFALKMHWDDIVYAELNYRHGIPYLLLRAEGHLTPLMVSTWLLDPAGFAAEVRRHVATDHPLVLLLDDLERNKSRPG